MSEFLHILHSLRVLDRRDPPNLHRYPPVPQVDYPCCACGGESTHEIIHRGAPLDVCDGCDITNGDFT